MPVCVNVLCARKCMYVCVCLYVCMCVCMRVNVKKVFAGADVSTIYISRYQVCANVLCACMCVCMCVYVRMCFVHVCV